MFMINPNPTPYDLRWQMFGIQVRVHPFFWVMAAALGWDFSKLGAQYLLVWVGCVFVSILVHELGHVIAGRSFGVEGHIVLYMFGGLAMHADQFRHRWQHIIMCFAGPLAGFLLLGGVLAYYYLLPLPKNILLIYAGLFLYWINLYWGLLNLLPVWPLDGGQISRDVFDWLLGDNGARIALGISLVFAGLLTAASIANTGETRHLPWFPFGGLWSTILFGSLALGSFAALQAEDDRRRFWADRYTPPDDRDDCWRDERDSYRR